MNHSDIIVLIEFEYFPKPKLCVSSSRKTIQRFSLVENESDYELEKRIYKWLEEKGYKREDICNLRLVYEGNI